MTGEDGETGDGETPGEEGRKEKLTRNLDELLQELRVTQTGVQILTAFLLTVPFTQVFAHLDPLQRHSYLAVLSGAVVSTGLVVAPVAFHRALFGDNEREMLMHAADRLAKAGLGFLALTMCGVVWLVFDVVSSRPIATAAGLSAVVFFVVLWLVVPLAAKRRVPTPERQRSGRSASDGD